MLHGGMVKRAVAAPYRRPYSLFGSKETTESFIREAFVSDRIWKLTVYTPNQPPKEGVCCLQELLQGRAGSGLNFEVRHWTNKSLIRGHRIHNNSVWSQDSSGFIWTFLHFPEALFYLVELSYQFSNDQVVV